MADLPLIGSDSGLINVWVVRAQFGTFTENFVSGGYVGLGWIPDENLADVTQRESLYPLYRHAYPQDDSNIVIGQQVGQIARFLFEIQAGDFVLTPTANPEFIRYGQVAEDPSYHYSNAIDGCPYRHRRRVNWKPESISRLDFSVPFQNTLRSSLTVFAVSHRNEFLTRIGMRKSRTHEFGTPIDSNQLVINRILELDASEFEILIGHLLTAIGFEGTEVTGKPGDGGVDVVGDLTASNLATVKVYVQAKRYKSGSKIRGSTVRGLRQAIPFGGQGAFITTADYQQSAYEIASDPQFPRIGLINGSQLVDLLIENWDSIPSAFQEKLGLKPGLILIS